MVDLTAIGLGLIAGGQLANLELPDSKRKRYSLLAMTAFGSILIATNHWNWWNLFG